MRRKVNVIILLFLLLHWRKEISLNLILNAIGGGGIHYHCGGNPLANHIVFEDLIGHKNEKI